jgi:hypothetical protein
MKRIIGTSIGIATVALVIGGIQAKAQSVNFDFSGGTANGWANSGFGSSPTATVANIGGLNYIYLPLGGFQVGNVGSGYTGNLAGFDAAMSGALNNPAGYTISYDYYVDTSTFVGTTFLQFGTFLNAGSGFYSQSYGNPNQLELNGTQTGSGQIFQGHISVNVGAVFANDANAATENFFRLGLIENGNGTGVGVYVRNISVAPVPEPSSLALAGLGLVGGSLLLLRRRLA